MSLDVHDGRTGLLTELIPGEDAYTAERSKFAAGEACGVDPTTGKQGC
ncbi:hypothetical protein [Singulisphaera sp. GP187]|nr:hypothetical protein [Singulisphaera sp. GP187]